MGHGVRQDPHPDHRVGVRAPAHHVVLVLLRPAHTRLRVPRRALVLHQGEEKVETLIQWIYVENTKTHVLIQSDPSGK